jgi:hypothetical protein
VGERRRFSRVSSVLAAAECRVIGRCFYFLLLLYGSTSGFLAATSVLLLGPQCLYQTLLMLNEIRAHVLDFFFAS